MPDTPPDARPPFPKVTAYVTCERDGLLHLLLFRHPLAGVQLPAGSIEEDEDPMAAAVREVVEETGLRDVTDPVSLGATTSHLPPGSRILLRSAVPRRSPDTASASSSPPLRRGLTVDLIELVANHAHVRADIVDHGRTPPELISRRDGWIDIAALGSTVVRHHVHLRHDGQGPDQWTQLADGHEFALFWAPLIPRPDVCAAQFEWLEFAYDRVIQRASG